MKKIFFLLSALFSLTLFSQNNSSSFNYKAKFGGITDTEKASGVMSALKTVFKTDSHFNESTGFVEFNSKMSINQNAFHHLMAGEGYELESFEKQEVKEAPAAEAAPVVTEPAKKKDAPSTVTVKAPGQ